MSVILCFALLSTAADSFAFPVKGDRPVRGDSQVLQQSADDIARDAVAHDAAVKAFGENDDKYTLKALITAHDNRVPSVDMISTLGLLQLDESLRALMIQTIMGSPSALEQLVARNDPRSIPPLIKALVHWTPAVNQVAAEALVALGNSDVVDQLIIALQDLDPILRREAAEVLGAIGDPRAADPLIKRLTDQYPSVRIAVVQSLYKLETPQARTSFIRALEDTESAVRETAAWGLLKVGDQSAADALLKTLVDKNSAVRRAAVWALGKTADRRAVAPLVKIFTEGRSSMREGAAWSLGKIGDQLAVDPMIEALGVQDSKVRETAALAIESLGDPLGLQIHKALSGSPEAMQSLVRNRDLRAVTPLIAALENDDPMTRRAAARCLGDLNEIHAVGGLAEMAGSWNLVDRAAATTALVAIDQAGFFDYIGTVVSVLMRPASIVYFLGVVLLVLVFRRRRKVGS